MDHEPDQTIKPENKVNPPRTRNKETEERKRKLEREGRKGVEVRVANRATDEKRNNPQLNL